MYPSDPHDVDDVDDVDDLDDVDEVHDVDDVDLSPHHECIHRPLHMNPLLLHSEQRDINF